METLSAAQDDSSGANPSSVKSDDSSPQRGSGAGSPPPKCAICLGTCKNKSFTDSCLHQFCFSCLLTWSKVKAECPLCKQNFRSIIHNVRANNQYEEYMVVQRQAEESSSRIDIEGLTATHRFRYRTTLTLPRRQSIAFQELLRHYPFMADVFPPPSAARAPPPRRRRSPAAFRRTVYRHNLWARPLPDFTGRFRDCTPEFYRYNDTQMHRLVPWLNRELHYLLNENVGHISYVMTRILDLLPQHHINSPEFREALHRYFGERTEHFLHEFYCFASTPYDMTGYDRNVQYTTDSRISTMINEVISSSEASDSDIVMVSEEEESPADRRSARFGFPSPAYPPPAHPPPAYPRRAPDAEDEPAGPSHRRRPRQPPPAYPPLAITRRARRAPAPAAQPSVVPIETISHSDTDDDDDEVMVVGYIKPPQERTPEIVDLLGSDSDVVVQESQPEPAPAVKLTLKRRRTRSHSSDEYRPPSRTRRPPRSPAPAAPASPPPAAPAPASSATRAASWSSSSSSDTDSDFSPAAKRKSKKSSSRSSPCSSRDGRRRRRRASRSRRRDKRVASAHEGRGRKSHSGKGVKSSSKADREPGAGPSAPPDAEPRARRRRRERGSRETRRLKSVVNVMYKNHNQSADEPSSSAHCSSTLSNASSADAEETPSSTSTSASTCSHSDATRRRSTDADESTDSEDNIPLNLTLQKTSVPKNGC